MAGSLASTKLNVLPAEDSTWGAWKTPHPDSWVLSFATGFQRDYHEDPYYSFPLSRKPALLVTYGGAAKIYPFSELKKGPSPLIDHVGGREITITYDQRTQTAHIENQSPEVTAFVAFLDDLKAFYRGANVYRWRRP